MNHLTQQQFLEAVEGPLSNELEFHLRSCHQCEQTMNTYKQAERALHNVPLEKVPENFTTTLMRQIGLKESSSFAWSLSKNIAPIFALFLVVGIALAAVKFSDLFGGPEVAGQASQSVYHNIGQEVKGGMTALNGWISTYMSFAFAKDTIGLSVFVLIFFGVIALFDRYLLMPMMRRRV